MANVKRTSRVNSFAANKTRNNPSNKQPSEEVTKPEAQTVSTSIETTPQIEEVPEPEIQAVSTSIETTPQIEEVPEPEIQAVSTSIETTPQIEEFPEITVVEECEVINTTNEVANIQPTLLDALLTNLEQKKPHKINRSFYIDEYLYLRLKKSADEHKTSVSDVLNTILEKVLQ